MYRCETTSVEGFIQQLAVSYVANGYWFYVAGMVPAHKDPRRTDEKIVRQYDIAVSKWTRCRRKKIGLANLQYVRHDRFFVILATHGRHSFFESEAKRIRDIRRVPLKYGGYAVSCRRGIGGWHPSVRIEARRHRTLQKNLIATASIRPVESLVAEMRTIGFEPYAPVKRQLRMILRAMNQKRSTAGLDLVPTGCLPRRRIQRLPFGPKNHDRFSTAS